MNTGIVIMGVVLVSICALPFILADLKRRKKANWYVSKLREMAAQNQAAITKYDFCRDFILGIDEKNNQLFYFQFRGDTEMSQHINLKEIAACKVINKSRTIDRVTVVDQLLLNFKPATRNKDEINWMLYSTDYHTQLDDELQLSAKWATLINKQLV